MKRIEIAKDQLLLESLVKIYGKKDVIKYINRLNEAEFDNAFDSSLSDYSSDFEKRDEIAWKKHEMEIVDKIVSDFESNQIDCYSRYNIEDKEDFDRAISELNGMLQYSYEDICYYCADEPDEKYSDLSNDAQNIVEKRIEDLITEKIASLKEECSEYEYEEPDIQDFNEFANNVLDDYIEDNYQFSHLTQEEYDEISDWLNSEEAIDFIISEWESDGNNSFPDIRQWARSACEDFYIPDPEEDEEDEENEEEYE